MLAKINESKLSPADRDVIADAHKRIYKAARKGPELDCPEIAAGLFMTYLAGKESEEFVAAYLDTRHRLIVIETLFQGTIDGATVHPRVLARRALELNAAAIIVAHNHPAGNPEPSRQDVALTRRLGKALEILDIPLLDHFVCGSEGHRSLAEMGLYQQPMRST